VAYSEGFAIIVGVESTTFIATFFLFVWGLLGLYSGIKDDGKPRFMMMGWLGNLLDKTEDQNIALRIKNRVFGLLCVLLAVGLLYIQFK